MNDDAVTPCECCGASAPSEGAEMMFPPTDSTSVGVLYLPTAAWEFPHQPWSTHPESEPGRPQDDDAVSEDVPAIDGKRGWPLLDSVRAQPPLGLAGCESRAEYAQDQAKTPGRG